MRWEILLQRNPPLRDRKYLNWLRTQPCIVTGQYGDDHETVDPAHMGTAGVGLKSDDCLALPLLHSIHAACHQKGEMTVLRKMLPNDVLRAALRAYAREMYQQWSDGNE